jgi:hypothetical protein
MAARTQVGKKHFMKTVRDELAKFEHKEIEFQKTERNQRAARLRLPIGKHYPPRTKSATDGSVQSRLMDIGYTKEVLGAIVLTDDGPLQNAGAPTKGMGSPWMPSSSA